MAAVKIVRVKYDINNKELEESLDLIEDIADEFGVTAKEIDKVNKELKQTEKETKKVDKQVGGIAGSLKKLGPIIAAAFSVAAISSFFKTAVTKSKEFESALTSLSKITGAVGSDLDFFNSKAKELALETGIAGEEVLKAFELVGSAKPELLESGEALAAVTEEAIKLSQASGLDLETAINSLTNTLNQFGAGAEDAAKFVDSLAAGAKFGASAIPDTAEALKNFGTVAKAANIDIDQAGALVQVLAEKGIKGSEAGIKLRNVLLILQKDTKNYTDGVFDLNLALENQAGIQNDNIALLEKFDKENITGAQILIQSRKQLEKLTGQLGTLGIAQEQAAKELQTLDNAFRRFEALIDEVFLAVGDKLAPVLLGLINIFTETRTEGQKVADEFQTQLILVGQLRDETEPLIDTYVDLTSKAKLSKEEQAELDSVVRDLATTLPTTALEFDGYGNAIGVSTEKAKAFILEQKELLVALNFEAINKLKKETLDYSERILELSGNIADGTQEHFVFGNTIQASEFRIKAFRKELGASTGTVIKNIQELERLGFEFSDFEKANINAALGVPVFSDALDKLAKPDPDPAKTVSGLGDAVKKTGKEFIPAAGSIAHYRAEVSRLQGEVNNAVINTEDFADKTDKLRFAQILLNNALGKTSNAIADQGTTLQENSSNAADFQIAQLQRISDAEEKFRQDTSKAEQIAADEEDERRRKLFSDISEGIGTALTAIDGFVQASLNKQLNALNAQKEAQLASVGDNTERRAQIEEEFAAKEEALRKKNGEQAKAIAIIQAIINTALGVTQAFAQGGVAGFITGALIAAAGASQIALISSQQFAKGGYTGNGLGMTDSTGERVAGTVHAKEFVFDKSTTAKWLPIFNEIHSGKMKPGDFVASPSIALSNGDPYNDQRLYKQLVMVNRNLSQGGSRPIRYGKRM